MNTRTSSNRNRSNRFSRFNQPVECRVCHRMTTEVVDGCIGLDLCRACREAAEMENEHSDGHHEGAPHADCPDCRAAAPAPVALVVDNSIPGSLDPALVASLENQPLPAPVPSAPDLFAALIAATAAVKTAETALAAAKLKLAEAAATYARAVAQ